MDSDLAALIAEHERAWVPPAGWPTPAPAAGQTRQQWAAEVARLREQHNAAAVAAWRIQASPSSSPVATVSYQDIPVNGAVLTGRVYTPTGPPPYPVVVFLHGGGWWMGGGATGFELNDSLCRVLSAGLSAVVVNVDYRLAPEHPYPVPLDDAYRSLTWVRANAHELQADPDRLSVLGISSGGNLAAATALLARDRGVPIRAQLLITPALDATASSPSILRDQALHAEKTLVRRLYTQGQPDLTVPFISPSHAEQLAGLPPTVMVVGDYDPLREEAGDYARRLEAAGVAVTVQSYPMTHTVAVPHIRQQWQHDLVAQTAKLVEEW